MELYGIPQGVSAVYTYKGIRLTWDDLPSCSYYTVYLNLENDPVNGTYKLVSSVIDTPNEYVIQNNLVRERTIFPYIKILGYKNTPSLHFSFSNNTNGNIDVYTNGIDLSNITKVRIYSPDLHDLTIDSVTPETNGYTLLHSPDNVPDYPTGGELLIVEPPLGTAAEYSPFTVRYKPRKVAIEIARRLDVLFKARYKDAALVQVWHRRRHGEHCTCWDKYEGAVTNPNCELCYGVGFKGGYVGPEEMYITYGVEARNGGYNSFGEQLNVHDTLVTGIGNMDAYVMPNDIIIDALGNRYTVTSVSYSSIDKSVIVSQRLGLQKLPRNDIVYKLGS